MTYTLKQECNKLMRAENPSMSETDLSDVLHNLDDYPRNISRLVGPDEPIQESPPGGDSKTHQTTKTPTRSKLAAPLTRKELNLLVILGNLMNALTVLSKQSMRV